MDVSTNYGQHLPFLFEKAEQIPAQCLSAATALESQPLFNGYGSKVKTCKVIPLQCWDDTRIFDIFNTNARRFIGDKGKWDIHNFGWGSNQLEDANHHPIQKGLILRLYDNVERCSLAILKEAYSSVYNSMRTGWVQSNPEEYQNIMFKKDTERFALFVKKDKNLEEEDDLIRFLISKFELNGQIECQCEWLKKDSRGSYIDKTYMWIDKEELSKIIEKFGFEIS